MDGREPEHRRADRLRRTIERKTGRPLDEIVRGIYEAGEPTADQIACACTRLAGEVVTAAEAETWLRQLSLAGREQQWAAMVPRLREVLDQLIEEEVERRLAARERTPGGRKRDYRRGDCD